MSDSSTIGPRCPREPITVGGMNASGMSAVACPDERTHEGVQPGRRCAFISPTDQHDEVGKMIKEEKAMTTNYPWILMRKTKQDKKGVSREEDS